MRDGDAAGTAAGPGLWQERPGGAAEAGLPVVDAVARNAERFPDRPALIDVPAGRQLRYGRLAALARAAAGGLAVHGVRPGDAGAVLAAGARDLVLAAHALAAAGAVPLLLPPGAPPGELADQLVGGPFVDGDVRLLLASLDLAETALAVTELSYVRQVFVFGECAGTTPFSELLSAGGLLRPAADPLRDLALCTPLRRLTHADRLAELARLSGMLDITGEDVLVGCDRDVAGQAVTWLGLIDLALTRGATVATLREPGRGALPAAIDRYRATVLVASPATVRALAFEPPAERSARLRVALTGRASPELARTCRGHGWRVVQLP